ncbi:hypothetical protein Sjap_009185 [Stephania japonica]|uniref:Uncharacterized protein n=1 Tax=Stephania japonica TaxID=461633 RepID=A0AAP0JQX4_9MAGN|nr:COMT protein [Stephania japonica]
MAAENLKQHQAAQAKLWSYIYGYTESLVLKSAVQLDIPDIIHNHGKPISLSDLACQISSPSGAVDHNRLYRIMRYLVYMKFFTKESVDGEDRYGLAPPAKYLVKGWEKSMVPSILSLTNEEFMLPWYHLKDGLLNNGTTALEKALGMPIWDYMSTNPKTNNLFNEAMACDTRLTMSALVSECKDVFQGIKSLVDVGGGTGTAVRYIAKAFPHINCTVYDLPHVAADSPTYPEVTRTEGDMFKYIPKADAILMKYILHDWADEESIQILKKCKEALPSDRGKVILVDIVLNPFSEHPYAKVRMVSDVDMMQSCGGKERTEEEWKKLIYAAGFSRYNIRLMNAIPSVIEVFP